jgi:hypothetical protein
LSGQLDKLALISVEAMHLSFSNQGIGIIDLLAKKNYKRVIIYVG